MILIQILVKYSFTVGTPKQLLLIWNSAGLQVQVEIEDSSIDESDAITVYIDSLDSKSENTDNIQNMC